ncbi:MAG: hypothetical protein IKT52_01125 [Oscillospiraceae bacterium]|nr:hypothetical protein [Oscillospiraceae bacterium]
MNPYIERLKEELDKNPPCYGYMAAHSLLDMLYMWYVEWNPITSEQIRQDFFELEAYFTGCTEKQVDEVINIITRLCQSHERLAFLEGLRVGIRLAHEL